MKCLVSGATGFVGRSLCRQLVDRGHTLIALSKSGTSLPTGMSTVAIDLSHSLPTPEMLEGVDVVFHLAAIAHQRAESAAYEALNHRAALAFARACLNAGVKRFVFISSVKAMGDAPAGSGERTEQDCTLPTDPYGLSKWQAEQSLRAEFAFGPMSVVILRPPLVYGASVKGNLAKLASAIRLGLPRPPDLGGRSMIAVDDLTAVMCVLVSAPLTNLQTWIVTDGQSYSTRKVYDALRYAMGKSLGKLWMPQPIWRFLASAIDTVTGAERGETFNKLFGTELYSNRAIVEAISWQPNISLEQVAEDMVQTRRVVR
ncbi:MAG: NAD-dependent epimerase/dehydratase family protein [Pseudomonadota bacterium]